MNYVFIQYLQKGTYKYISGYLLTIRQGRRVRYWKGDWEIYSHWTPFHPF